MIRNIIKSFFDKDIGIVATETNDNRSYHVCSDKIRDIIGFEPSHSITEAVLGICNAYYNGELADYAEDKYYRIRSIKNMGLAA
jgi:hypothetical protein